MEQGDRQDDPPDPPDSGPPRDGGERGRADHRTETTAAATLPAPDAGSSAPAWPDPDRPPCLLAVLTASAADLGRTFRLAPPVVTVGRVPDNDIVLDDGRVSRRHCRFSATAGGEWSVDDLGSKNGTYVNGKRVRQSPLALHDKVEIGSTVFHFEAEGDERVRQLQAVLRAGSVDGVSGLWNREHLDRTMAGLARRASDKNPVAVALISVGRVGQVAEAYGQSAADRAIRHVGDLLGGRLPAGCILGRFGGAHFLLVFEGARAHEAGATAARLLDALRDEPPLVEGTPVPLDAAAGVAELLEPGDPAALLKDADDALATARRKGGGVAVSRATAAGAAGGPAERMRRIYEGRMLVEAVLARPEPAALVVLDAGDDSVLVDLLGIAGRDILVRRLLKTADDAVADDGLVGVWHGRYVLLGLRGEKARGAGAVADAIARRWSSWSRQWDKRGLAERGLRWSAVGDAEIREHGADVLGILAARCCAEPAARAKGDPAASLPFPLAAGYASLATCRTSRLRVEAICNLLDTGLRFLVAIQTTLLGETDDPEVRGHAARLLAPRVDGPSSMGTWLELARELAKLLPRDAGGRAGEAARALVTARGKPSELAKLLDPVPDIRKRVYAHGGSVAEEPWTSEEKQLRRVVDSFLEAVQPLTGVDMVSVAGIDDVDDDARQVAYSLHLHSGPAEQFPIVKRTVGGRLHKGWCYLLDPTLGRPLLLAPLWLAATCEKCRRLEIFAAPGLMLGPPGRSIALRAAVVTDHETTAEIPRAESLQALHEAVCAVRREGPKQRAEEPR